MIETNNTTNPPRSDCRQASRRLLRTREAAAYLGVSAWKLRRLVTDSRLPYVNDGDGSPWRFDLCDLQRYVEGSKARF
jgi:excisionase family DNA binding protein